MKLLLISVLSNKTNGGIAIWTSRFLANCGVHDIDCHLVNTEMVGKRSENATANRNIFDELFRSFRIFRDTKNALRNNDFSAAHLNTSCGTFGLFRDYFVALMIKKKGVRLITHFHCDIPYWINNSLSRRCLGKLVSISDVNLVLCENSRQYLEQQFGAISHKVPNFLDSNVIRNDERKINQILKTAFFVGRVEEAKGAKEIFEVAKRFPDINFRLAGEISEVVSSWDKPNNVFLLGPLPHNEVLNEMDEADVFIFPSHTEGFSLALAEAMARGLPAIATNVGAAEDMLSDGCGCVVPVGDVEKIKSALEAFNDAQKREQLSYASITKAKKQYTTKAVVQKILVYYVK